MRKPYQFNPEVVFPRVAKYIRQAGTSYIGHIELVKLLEKDEMLRSHVKDMQKGSYRGGVQDIVTKMVGYFSWAWTTSGPYIKEYQEEFERDRIDNRYAYRVK